MTGKMPDQGRRGSWNLVAALVLAAAVIRLATLGLESPWLDELNNWQRAEETGFSWPPSIHVLTTWCQAAGLALSDSAWGLRLYSALFGLAGFAIILCWANERFGRQAMLSSAVILALSPFWWFYTADANHYAPMLLAGPLAALSVDWFLLTGRWTKFLAALAVVVVSVGFHPLGALSAGALLIAGFVWLLVNVEILPPAGLPARTRRLLLIAAALGAAFLCLYTLPIFDFLEAQSGYPIGTERLPGLDFEFWSPLLADLYGNLFHHYPLDIATGFLGLFLCVTGWIWTARRGAPWAAAGAGMVFLVNYLPFQLMTMSTHFYPKFLSSSQPLLLLGVALFAHFALREFRSVPWARAPVFAVAAFLCLYAFSTARYTRSHWEADYMQTRQAIDWILEETPENAVILTRNDFSSSAFRFFWSRRNESRREHIALSYIERCGAPSIQQAEELIVDSGGRPVYFLSFFESRATEADDFRGWLEEKGETVRHFPSAATDDFVPFDRSITIRRITAEADSFRPFILPRPGARASSLLFEEQMSGLSRGGTGRIKMPNMSGISYNFELNEMVEGLELRFAREDGWAKGDELWLVALIDNKDALAIFFDDKPPAEARVLIPQALPAGRHRIEFFVRANRGVSREPLFSPLELAAQDKLAEMDTFRMRPLELVAKHPAGPEKHLIDSRGWLRIEHPYPKLPSTGEPGRHLVLQRIRIDGLPDRAIDMRAVLPGGEEPILCRGPRWTFGWGVAAAPMGGESPESLSVSTKTFDRQNRRARGEAVFLDPAGVYLYPAE